ncbi:hypothetical protein C8046_17200 [Serinibacter arcticus]|uniref:Uncharacterized protein n=1 Tax=Serinibacter arcticus TaxID=1655435 RepID=A0A2U1ZYQ7_9MICO|nr:hypothetical protein [Serinibacter arcticus]PWD52119.1 hypothetical protein C8046_17200 [Serinibacter arcticus]
MRTRGASTAVLGLALVSVVVGPSAQGLENGYYSVPYSPTLYRHDHHGDGTESTVAAEFAQWQADGSPDPRPAPVDYVRYPWSSEIHAVHFFAPGRDTWLWQNLTYDQWSSIGRPSPRAAGWIQGSTFWTYSSSSEIFVQSSDAETPHKLTFAEWIEAGSPAPEAWGRAFYKYAWAPSIGYMLEPVYGFGRTITFDEWASFGRPTPREVVGIRGERVWRYAGSSQIYFDSSITGPGYPLTLAQWTTLGRPAPEVV